MAAEYERLQSDGFDSTPKNQNKDGESNHHGARLRQSKSAEYERLESSVEEGQHLKRENSNPGSRKSNGDDDDRGTRAHNRDGDSDGDLERIAVVVNDDTSADHDTSVDHDDSLQQGEVKHLLETWESRSGKNSERGSLELGEGDKAGQREREGRHGEIQLSSPGGMGGVEREVKMEADGNNVMERVPPATRDLSRDRSRDRDDGEIGEEAGLEEEGAQGRGSRKAKPLRLGPSAREESVQIDCDVENGGYAVGGSRANRERLDRLHVPVLTFATNGDVQGLAELCRHQPQVLDQRFEWGWTVAHFAAACGIDEVLVWLSNHDHGAWLHLLSDQNESGMTPMHYAAANGQYHALRVLLRKAQDSIHIKCIDGRRPLDVARSGQCALLLKDTHFRVERQARKDSQRSTQVSTSGSGMVTEVETSTCCPWFKRTRHVKSVHVELQAARRRIPSARGSLPGEFSS